MKGEGAKHLSKGKWVRLRILDLSKGGSTQAKTLSEVMDCRLCSMATGPF